MAGPSTKRLKMDNSGDRAVVTKKELMSPRFAETFRKVVKADSYVDKSLLIYKLFHQESTPADATTYQIYEIAPGVMITAPRCFGKSVNMDMLKCFLEIQCDATGKGIPRKDVRSNYKLFNGLRIMAPEYAEFVRQHFGKYPVIKVNFLCKDSITNLEDAVNFCKKVLHDAFKEHKYLQTSRRLSKIQKMLCDKWCCYDDYNTMNKTQTTDALNLLSTYLYEHFKTQVFVLIDEYDSLITEAVFSPDVNPNEIDKIMEFYIGVLASLLKGNNYVFGAVVTGISYIAGVDISSKLGTLTTYQFLNNNHYVEYYGFTDLEVDNLFLKFKVSDKKRDEVKQAYNGYKSRNGDHTIYNPYSVVKYLSDRRSVPVNHWVNSGIVYGMKGAFKHQVYRKDLNTLLSGNCVAVDVHTKLEKDDIERLAALSSGNKMIPLVHVFLYFILEQGYLSYAERDNEKKSFLKVPNEGIKKEFHKQLRDAYIHEYKVDVEHINNCSNSFVKLFCSIPKNKTKLEESLGDVKSKLQDLLSDELLSNIGKLNHATVKQIFFLPLIQTGLMYSSDICSPSNTRPDFFMGSTKCGVIIELKFAQRSNDYRNTADAGLKQIFDKHYVRLFSDKTYFPDGIEEFILMGLCVIDDIKRVSICSLCKKKGGSELTVNDIAKAIYVD